MNDVHAIELSLPDFYSVIFHATTCFSHFKNFGHKMTQTSAARNYKNHR